MLKVQPVALLDFKILLAKNVTLKNCIITYCAMTKAFMLIRTWFYL